MRLSEAMMLGSTTCKMIPADINSCALGAAGNAIGIPKATIAPSYLPKCVCSVVGGRGRLSLIFDAWPWLSGTGHGVDIFTKFDHLVCSGQMTFEQLVDYVRSVEPECGDCNQFDCTCVQKMDSVPTAVETFV